MRLYQALQRLPTLLSALMAHTGSHTPLLQEVFIAPVAELQSDLEKLSQLVETTVDLDMVEHHEFVIKPSFDDGLMSESETADVRSMQCCLCRATERDG